MSSFLGKIKGFFIKAKSKKVLFLLFLFVFINFILLLEPAKAQFIDFRGGFVGAITDILLGISSLFIKVTVWISQLFIVIASYNNFINSKAVILGWVLVRDVVNMFFVLILLVIAFGTVLGLEQYEWKKLLVKLVFAAVLVNFSRLICGVIIDAAQVFMMTFVNGFAATAGGNVINGLNLNKIYNLSVNADPKNITSDTDMLVTGVGAVFFGSISMFVLGAYLIVMLARVVSLWVLIVLSPIAFISSVLPATQKYASEWWKEFNNNVLAGPLLAFFFWLSFAVVGGGDSFQEVLPTDAAKKYETNALFGSTATGVAQAMDWGAMASFAIAIALLITGVKKTQELGVQGAGMLSSALSTAKKVGMYASGIKLAGWAGQKVYGGAKIVGGDLTNRAKLAGMGILKESYKKEELTGKKGILARTVDLATTPGKLIKSRADLVEKEGAILDTMIGSKWTLQAKERKKLADYELQKREEAKQAGESAFVQKSRERFEADPANQKFLEKLEDNKRGSVQISGIMKEQDDIRAKESDLAFTEKEKKLRDKKMAPYVNEAEKYESEARDLEEKNKKEEAEIKAEEEKSTKEIEKVEKEKEEIVKEKDKEKEETTKLYESSTLSGIKESLPEKLEEIEAKFKAKLDAKDLEKEKLKESMPDFDKRREQIAKNKRDIEEDIKVAQTIRKEGDSVYIRDLTEGLDADLGGGVEGGKEQKKLIAEILRRREQVDLENKAKDLGISKDEAEARRRARAYEESGNLVKAATLNAHADGLAFKADSEGLENLSQNELKNLQKQMLFQITKLREDIKAGEGGPDAEKKLKNMENKSRALSTFSSGVDGETSLAVTASSLSEEWYKNNGGVINDKNRTAAILSQFLMKDVNQGEEEKALEELQKAYKGKEGELNALLGKAAANFKKAGMNGDLTKVGLIDESMDPVSGATKYAFRAKPDNSEETMDYFLARMKAGTLAGMGNVNKDGQIVGFSDTGLKQMERFFKGKTELNISHKDFVPLLSSLNNASVTKENVKEYQAMLERVGKSVKDEAAFKAFTKQIDKLINKIDKVNKVKK